MYPSSSSSECIRPSQSSLVFPWFSIAMALASNILGEKVVPSSEQRYGKILFVCLGFPFLTSSTYYRLYPSKVSSFSDKGYNLLFNGVFYVDKSVLICSLDCNPLNPSLDLALSSFDTFCSSYFRSNPSPRPSTLFHIGGLVYSFSTYWFSIYNPPKCHIFPSIKITLSRPPFFDLQLSHFFHCPAN